MACSQHQFEEELMKINIRKKVDEIIQSSRVSPPASPNSHTGTEQMHSNIVHDNSNIDGVESKFNISATLLDELLSNPDKEILLNMLRTILKDNYSLRQKVTLLMYDKEMLKEQLDDIVDNRRISESRCKELSHELTMLRLDNVEKSKQISCLSYQVTELASLVPDLKDLPQPVSSTTCSKDGDSSTSVVKSIVDHEASPDEQNQRDGRDDSSSMGNDVTWLRSVQDFFHLRKKPPSTQ